MIKTSLVAFAAAMALGAGSAYADCGPAHSAAAPADFTLAQASGSSTTPGSNAAGTTGMSAEKTLPSTTTGNTPGGASQQTGGAHGSTKAGVADTVRDNPQGTATGTMGRDMTGAGGTSGAAGGTSGAAGGTSGAAGGTAGASTGGGAAGGGAGGGSGGSR